MYCVFLKRTLPSQLMVEPRKWWEKWHCRWSPSQVCGCWSMHCVPERKGGGGQVELVADFQQQVLIGNSRHRRDGHRVQEVHLYNAPFRQGCQNKRLSLFSPSDFSIVGRLSSCTYSNAHGSIHVSEKVCWAERTWDDHLLSLILLLEFLTGLTGGSLNGGAGISCVECGIKHSEFRTYAHVGHVE